MYTPEYAENFIPDPRTSSLSVIKSDKERVKKPEDEVVTISVYKFKKIFRGNLIIKTNKSIQIETKTIIWSIANYHIRQYEKQAKSQAGPHTEKTKEKLRWERRKHFFMKPMSTFEEDKKILTIHATTTMNE